MLAAKYNELLKHVELVDVHLQEIRASLGKWDPSERSILNFKEDFSVIENEADHVCIAVSYQLDAKSKRRNVFNIKARYQVTFKTSKPIPPEFFEMFNKWSLPVQTFPYLRELVNSMISRMGLPPLVLPLRKYLVGGDS